MTSRTTPDTREFHIGDILSVTDGHLVSPRHMDGIYDLLSWMTGESVWTHQIPRVMRECEDNLRAQHPDLAAVVFPEGLNGKEAIYGWLAEQVSTYGETRRVTPLPAGDHTRIDPVAELRMNHPDTPIIAVVNEVFGTDGQQP